MTNLVRWNFENNFTTRDCVDTWRGVPSLPGLSTGRKEVGNRAGQGSCTEEQ